MDVVILGNGITGVSAALRIRRERPDWRIRVVSGESTHHYSRPALMYVFMGHMSYADTKPYEDSFWKEQRIELTRGWVARIDFGAREMELENGERVPYERLLLATGSCPNRFGWPGQDLEGVQGFYGLDDLRRLIELSARARRCVIVGGGLIGIELAEMLHSRGIHVTMLVREDHYWGNILPRQEGLVVHDVLRERGVDLRTRTELAEILDDGSGRACAVVTDHGDRLDCQIVGLTAGVSPNLSILRDCGLRVDRGVLVDDRFRTNLDGVFAAGDCAQLPDGRIQQVWYTGREQGELAGASIAGLEVAYRPAIWFNSAKFFDLEFQTYGEVPPDVDESRSFYWQDDSQRRALRIVHDGGRVTGFNFFGMRARHRVCERWIVEGARIESVVEELSAAHFDGEFEPCHQQRVRRAFAEGRA